MMNNELDQDKIKLIMKQIKEQNLYKFELLKYREIKINKKIYFY